MPWVSIHTVPCDAFVSIFAGMHPTFAHIPALWSEVIEVAGEYQSVVAYTNEPGTPAPYGLNRHLTLPDPYAHYVCLVPTISIEGRRFRVRVLNLRTMSEADTWAVLGIGNYSDGDGFRITFDSHPLQESVQALGEDTGWVEFPPVPTGEDFNLLGAFCEEPAWGGRIEWQMWEEDPPPADRKVMVRTSKDGGRTWGAWRESSLGALGEFQHRVRFRRFGYGRNFCFQVRVTSPLAMDHMGAVANIEVGQ